jgi:hypothetical protein
MPTGNAPPSKAPAHSRLPSLAKLALRLFGAVRKWILRALTRQTRTEWRGRAK